MKKLIITLIVLLISCTVYASTTVDLFLLSNKYSSIYYSKYYNKSNYWSFYIQWDCVSDNSTSKQNQWAFWNRVKIGQFFSQTNYTFMDLQTQYDFSTNTYTNFSILGYAFPISNLETIECGVGYFGNNIGNYVDIYAANKFLFEFDLIAFLEQLFKIDLDITNPLYLTVKNVTSLHYPIGTLPYIEIESTLAIDLLTWFGLSYANVLTFDEGVLSPTNRAFVQIKF